MLLQLYIWEGPQRQRVADISEMDLQLEWRRFQQRMTDHGLDRCPSTGRVTADIVVTDDSGKRISTHPVMQGHLPRGKRKTRACVAFQDAKRVMLFERFVDCLLGLDVLPHPDSFC